jgi:hypothetical protein
MAMNMIKGAVATLLTSGALLTSALQPATAQTATAPADRIYVELKDASLYDALEMIYKAAGNPSHVTDPSAKAINVGNALFQNQPWNEIVLNLARQNNFRFRNQGGTYYVEPRPVPTTGGFPGGFPGGMPPGGFPGARPGAGGGNPFGNIGTFGNRQMSPSGPSVTTRVSPQTRPGRLGANNRLVTAGGTFEILPLQHVYAGGIAFLFEGATVLTTQDFVIPQVAIEDSLFGVLQERDGTPQIEFEGTTDGGGGGGGGSGGGGGGGGGGR